MTKHTYTQVSDKWVQWGNVVMGKGCAQSDYQNHIKKKKKLEELLKHVC